MTITFIRPVLADVCLSPEQLLAKVSDWGVVSRIIDGDTIHLKDGRKIRLIGIDTPELGHHGEASQPYGRQAYEALVQLLKNNKKVGLSYDKHKKDRYQRILAYVSLLDGQSVAQLLLSKGLAHSIVIPPNDSRIKCFRSIETAARIENLGLWQLSENKWIAASHLSNKNKGMAYIEGKILSYSKNKKSIYLKLSQKLYIRIAITDKKYFPGLNFQRLIGKHIRVRGWLNSYRGRQSISVRTIHNFHL